MEVTLWDDYATSYDGIAWTDPYQQMLKQVVDLMPLRPGIQILDAGCGTGNLEREILSCGVPVNITAVDFSSGMLERAKRKIITDQVDFQQLNLDERLPFPEESFDVVVALSTLYAVSNIRRTLSELQRVLKAGGRLIISDCKPDFSVSSILAEHRAKVGVFRTITTLLRFLPQILRARVVNKEIDKLAHQGSYRFRRKHQWQELLPDAVIEANFANQNWLITLDKSSRPSPK